MSTLPVPRAPNENQGTAASFASTATHVAGGRTTAWRTPAIAGQRPGCRARARSWQRTRGHREARGPRPSGQSKSCTSRTHCRTRRQSNRSRPSKTSSSAPSTSTLSRSGSQRYRQWKLGRSECSNRCWSTASLSWRLSCGMCEVHIRVTYSHRRPASGCSRTTGCSADISMTCGSFSTWTAVRPSASRFDHRTAAHRVRSGVTPSQRRSRQRIREPGHRVRGSGTSARGRGGPRC